MRQLSELISDVRFASNETDEERFPDERLLKFFNDAQDQIEALIIISNFENSPLDKFATLQSGKKKYSLPSDIYAWNSVSNVRFVNGRKIPRGHINDFVDNFYYYIVGKEIYFSDTLDNPVELLYKAKLPRLESTSDTPELPAMCESFLTTFVERKIAAINSSMDVQNAGVFTTEEKELITEIFSTNSSDQSNILELRETDYYANY